LAKSPPQGDRLDCLARLPHEPRPTTHLDSFSLKAPGKCENKDKSLVTFKRIKKQAADPTCSGNQCSARESHYSYGQLFCNTFFRSVSSES